MKTTMFILLGLMGLATAAQAQPPQFAQRYRIKHLAYELAEAAHHAYQNAEYCADLRRSTRAIDTLYRLDQQARRFNRKARRHYRHPYRTERAYRNLVRTYRQARRHMRHGHTAEVVFRDMRRIGRLLHRMSYLFDGYGHYGGYGHNGGYDGYEVPYRDNDHYRGDDYDHRYYGKKGKKRPLKQPRRTTPDY